MLISLIFLLTSLLNYKEFISEKIISQGFLITLIIIILFFIFNSYYSNSSFINPYTFKASSYIWVTGFYFFGIYFSKFHTISIKYLYLLIFLLIYLYYFAVFGLPDFVVKFFLNTSDKFEPHKGSDLLILFSSVFFISNRIFNNKRNAFEVFLIFIALYTPLLLYKSRGAFIGFLIFTIFELSYLIKYLNFNLKRNLIILLIATLVFLQSVTFINGSTFVKIENTGENVKYITEYRADPDEEKFKLLYFEEDYWTKEMRFKSTDNNLNWRLQIWQDVYFDLLYKDLYITGYGYSNKIPAMERIDRQGWDRLNENVHNYLVTIYARGGLIHLFLFILFYYFLIRDNKNFSGSWYFIHIFSALFFAALFDVAMENSHYPLIFFFLLGLLLNKKEIFKNY